MGEGYWFQAPPFLVTVQRSRVKVEESYCGSKVAAESVTGVPTVPVAGAVKLSSSGTIGVVLALPTLMPGMASVSTLALT